VPLTLTALAGVAPGETGLASGVFSAARQVGGAIGLAGLGTVAWAGATGRPAEAGGALATGAGHRRRPRLPRRRGHHRRGGRPDRGHAPAREPEPTGG